MIPATSLVLVLLGGFAAGRWGRPGAVLLALASLLWLAVNRPMEGRLIIVFSPEHGLVAADLVGFAGLGLAALVLLVGGRRT